MNAPASGRRGGRSTPAVLIVATPYVLATALAVHLKNRRCYEVHAPNIGIGDAAPRAHWDAVLVSSSSPAHAGSVVIVLPRSLENPVLVTAAGRTTEVRISASHPIDDIVSLLDRHLVGGV